MKDELIKLLDKAYAPYSKFQVAAIIEMKDGKYIPGVNVENASYGASICAERNAFTTAITMGYRKGDFKNFEFGSLTDTMVSLNEQLKEGSMDGAMDKYESMINVYDNITKIIVRLS